MIGRRWLKLEHPRQAFETNLLEIIGEAGLGASNCKWRALVTASMGSNGMAGSRP